METNELLVAAKAHDDYLLALDEAKRWWNAEDSLSAVISALDDGIDGGAELDGNADRWSRASVVFGDDVIAGLRDYLVTEGRAEPLTPPQLPAKPSSEATADTESVDADGNSETEPDAETDEPSGPISDLLPGLLRTKPQPKSAAATATPASRAQSKATPPVDPKGPSGVVAPARNTAEPEARTVKAEPRVKAKRNDPKPRRSKRNDRKGRRSDETAWGQLVPAPPAPDLALTTPQATETSIPVTSPTPAKEAAPDAPKPAKSARWANTLIAGGAVLLLLSLIGGLLLLTRNPSTPDDRGTAPSVAFSQCGPDRALGEVTNPASVPATLDIVVEFTDGDNMFFPVAVRLDVDAGGTAKINVPATGASFATGEVICVGFVSNFQAIS